MDESVITIHVEESGERIDALLARSLEETSRSAAQKLLLAAHMVDYAIDIVWNVE